MNSGGQARRSIGKTSDCEQRRYEGGGLRQRRRQAFRLAAPELRVLTHTDGVLRAKRDLARGRPIGC